MSQEYIVNPSGSGMSSGEYLLTLNGNGVTKIVIGGNKDRAPIISFCTKLYDEGHNPFLCKECLFLNQGDCYRKIVLEKKNNERWYDLFLKRN
jgi:hypothetical protein